MYKHQVYSFICQCILSSFSFKLVLGALALQPSTVLLLPFQSSHIISSHISFSFYHFCSLALSFCLVNVYQVYPVLYLSSHLPPFPASLDSSSIHSSNFPVLSSLPTSGRIQYFDLPCHLSFLFQLPLISIFFMCICVVYPISTPGRHPGPALFCSRYLLSHRDSSSGLNSPSSGPL